MEKEDIMSEESVKTENVEKEKKRGKSLAIGLDIGTMNLVCARSDRDQIKMTRNVFMPLDSDTVQISELSDISYIENEDGELFIIGSDAFKYANIFGQEVSRPMEKGLISSSEIDAIDILTLMIKDLIGDTKGYDAYCCYSIPAQAIDEGKTITYHKKVFGTILKRLGINHTSVNEAMAIIYSECAKEKFSGIGISFGAGMANVAVSYKGIEALTFSTARAGDWVDKNTGESIGMIPNRVTNIKERYMKLAGEVTIKNKKTRRVLESLYFHYTDLIDYTVKKIIKEFNDKVNIEVEEAIPIVVSGGTSLPDGFVQLFKDVISQYELPFEISEIRRAKNPLTAVANGLLIRTVSDIKGMK